MKILISLLIIIASVAAFALTKSQKQVPTPNQQVQMSPEPTPNQTVDHIASFTIVTGEITRNFSAQKYHNRAGDVYIENPDPSIVHVKKKGITWADFFNTLPMKLTKDCLITGDGETFCTGKTGTLKFYLNDVEDKDLLDREIKEGDKAAIGFNP